MRRRKGNNRMEQTSDRPEREAQATAAAQEQSGQGTRPSLLPGARRVLCAALARADAFVRAHPAMVLALCLVVMSLTAFLKFRLYPPTQFYDANGILNAVNAGGRADVDPSFQFAIAAFLPLQKIFGVMTLEQWGYLLLVPGGLVFAFLVWKRKPQSLFAALLLLCFSVLLPFFVLTTSKDMLQYLIFFLVALALMYLPNEWSRILAAAALLVPVVLLFRSYYVLLLGLSLLLFVLTRIYRAQRGVKRRTLLISAVLLAAVAGLFLLRTLLPAATDRLFTVRSMTNYAAGHDMAGDKIINDLLPLDRSVPGFLVNYITAAVRLLLPLELLASPGDAPFVVFELLLVGLLLAGFLQARRSGEKTAVYALIGAFFLMSFFFEPDFGSWFRHQAAAFPILWLGVGAEGRL